ncbi:mucin-2-like [Colletes gigas]|uniref:mucin-2-like n=1 Tax=Colletes gigas TaxID=935657 RepID=UPI001C9B849F|nr:mucin-2-like [Colletes gigas]
MGLVYITCILLATTSCSIAGHNVSTGQEDNKVAVPQTANLTTTLDSTEPKITNDTHGKTTDNATIIIPISTNPNSTTVQSTVSLPPTQTTTKPTDKPTTNTTVAPTTAPVTNGTTTITANTTTSEMSTVISSPVTTALPVSTKDPTPPYKERHFDGLSFLGGIILAICLMGIGVFSRKFYRTLSERNYRTL